MSILKSSLVVSGWTGISRVMGFVRDIVIANKLGTSAASDAFFIAILLPNLFRRLFAEGAFNVAFVPLLTRIKTDEGSKAAEEFASAAFSWLLIALLIVNLIAQIFMESLVSFVSFSPDNSPETFKLAVFFGRITFPYLFFITLASLMGGICNSYRRFAAFAFVPILLNVSYLSCLFIMPKFGLEPAFSASVAIPLGGFLQAAFMIFAMRKINFKLRPSWPPKHDKLSDLLKRLAPAALTVGFLQISFIIDSKFASNLEKWTFNGNPIIHSGENAISYLNYANKFYQFPLSLIGIAMATVLLPHLAAALERKDHLAVRVAFRDSLIAGFALGSAATAGLFVLALPLMKTFFEHGDFNAYSSQMSAWAMMGYCLGLPGYITTKITSSAFYANGDTKTPVKAVAVTLVINLIANMLLIQHLGHVGIAVATAISGWLNAIIQFWWLKRMKFVEIHMEELVAPLMKALLLGGAIFATLQGLEMLWHFGGGTILQMLWIAVALVVGGIVFVAGVHFGGMYDLSSVVRRFRKSA